MGRNTVINGQCYKCDVLLDPGEIICGTCQDNTDGRNEHFFQIKYEQHQKQIKGDTK